MLEAEPVLVSHVKSAEELFVLDADIGFKCTSLWNKNVLKELCNKMDLHRLNFGVKKRRRRKKNICSPKYKNFPSFYHYYYGFERSWLTVLINAIKYIKDIFYCNVKSVKSLPMQIL